MNTKQPCGCGQAGCGCCEGIEPMTPRPTANRPGLNALAYRIGTHASFLETMKARLTTHDLLDGEGVRIRPLVKLRTRDGSDPAIAFLDAWATVADVLTFYQERIANEGYLRTAAERRSVHELARLVGYAPRPGVVASTYLAYTIDENTKEDVVIAKGSRAQSVPGPGELPQSFETSEDLLARAAWNQLRPRTTQPQQFDTVLDKRAIYLRGVSTTLKSGDLLLIVNQKLEGEEVNEKDRAVLRITEVEVELEKDRTRVSVETWLPNIQDGRMREILDTAPDGSKVVAQVAENLKELLAQPAISPEAFTNAAMNAVADGEKDLHGLKAPVVRAWLGALKSVLEEPSAALTGSASGATRAAAETEVNLLGERVAALTRRPSQPLGNALHLPSSLESSFRKTSDAGLQLMGTVAPDLRDAISPMLTGTVKASEAGLEVYAFRVRAGVFGRQAPKRQAVVTSTIPASAVNRRPKKETTTEVIGEWPIIEIHEGMKDDETQRLVGAVHESAKVIHLESSHESILPDSWIVIDSSTVPIYRQRGEVIVRPAGNTSAGRVVVSSVVKAHAKVARAEYGVTGETTRLELKDPWLVFENIELTPPTGDPKPDDVVTSDQDQAMIDRDYQVIRSTTVFAQCEKLELAEEPITEALCDGADQPVELDGLYQDLQPGRFVVLSGERHGLGNETVVAATEPLMITEVVHDLRVRDASKLVPSGNDPTKALPGDRIRTFLYFDKPLSYCYRRDTVKIFGNVVKATHGETRNESLGSGDGSKPLQSFALKQPPLTHLAAPTAAGAESTLQVFVNDVRWHEGTTFVDRVQTDRIFVTTTDDDGKTSILFGNGREGARLPTGIENVKAVYRYGIGKPGNVRSGQITTLVTRPLGVKEVVNPLRASGGADRDSRDQARRNTPIAVMAFDRLVSTRDYADFTRTFSGIAKADAVELSDGRRNVVHLTIAGSDDIPIDRDSALFINLRHALRELGDPFQPIILALRELLILGIEAQIRILPDYLWEPVVTQVRARLLDTFGFERRELGQDVTSSEVLSAIQSVQGVAYVDLDRFGAIPATMPDAKAQDGRRPMTPSETADTVAKLDFRARVPASAARRDGDSIAPAQLAILVPDVPATLVLNQLK